MGLPKISRVTWQLCTYTHIMGALFCTNPWQILGYVVSQLITCDESQTSLVTGCTFLWFPSNGLGAYTKAKDSNRNVGPIIHAQIEPSPWFNWVSHHIQLKQDQNMKSDFKNRTCVTFFTIDIYIFHWLCITFSKILSNGRSNHQPDQCKPQIPFLHRVRVRVRKLYLKSDNVNNITLALIWNEC